jgi:hypothetical protein
MNKVELAKMASNNRVKIFADENNTALMALTLYPPIKTTFGTNLQLLDEAVQKKEEDIKMFATLKREAKRNMSENVIVYAERCKIQAGQLGLDEVVLILDKTVTYIYGATSEVALARAKELVDCMETHKEELTVIADDEIADLKALIEAYRVLMDVPKSEIEKRKAEGTTKIELIQKDIDKNKEAIGGLVHSYLPGLAESFDDANRIGEPAGTRRLSLEIHVADATGGSDLKGVLCHITNGSDEAEGKTGKRGFKKFYGLANGLWNVTVSFDNYETFSQDEVTVNDKKIMKMEVKLIKKVLPDKTHGNLELRVYHKYTEAKLEGVTLTLPAIDKTYISNAEGLIKGYDLMPGAYGGILTKNLLKTRTISFMIEGGETTETGFGMEEE